MKHLLKTFLISLLLSGIFMIITACQDSKTEISENVSAGTSDRDQSGTSSALSKQTVSVGTPSVPEKDPSSVENPAAGRELVWSDEFDNPDAFKSKWNFQQTMSGSGVYRNDDEHVVLSDGTLTLVSDMRETTGKHGKSSEIVLPQGLTTMRCMHFTYGYVEMRAILPYRRGAWPSFWMVSDLWSGKAKYKAEIDILEVFASSNSLACNIHKWGSSTVHDQWDMSVYKNHSYTFPRDVSPGEDYHLYGMEWTPEYLAFYVDGNEYCRIGITEADDFGTALKGMQGFHDPCYLIINNELFTENVKWMSESSYVKDEDFPILYTVDYVRLYQKSGEKITLY